MEKLLEVKNLELEFKIESQKLNILRNINIDFYKGELIGIVGESGSGKSVFLKTLIGMNSDNAKYINGSISFENYNLVEAKNKEWEQIRGKKISMIFQDPMNSLNPVLKISKQITEVIKKHQNIKNKKELNNKAIEYLNQVKINNPEQVLKMYPHQLSGGMKQRIVIAIILACQSKIILADEPTTAIDVSVQAEIISLLKELQAKFKLTIIFVTHDLGLIKSIANRICVMYAGKIVEYGKTEEIMQNSQHPYTRALLSSIPDIKSDQKLDVISGMPPILNKEIIGDAFAPRNKFAMQIDFEKAPPMFEVSPTHFAATWLLDENASEIKQKYDEYYRKRGIIQ